MAWGIDVPLAELAQRLVDTRLRVERIRLAHRVQMLEARVSQHGLSAEDLRAFRKSLQQATPLARDRVDRALVFPPKSVGVWRRRYLAVQTKPGSVF
jgi:hypothetical protein